MFFEVVKSDFLSCSCVLWLEFILNVVNSLGTKQISIQLRIALSQRHLSFGSRKTTVQFRLNDYIKVKSQQINV